MRQRFLIIILLFFSAHCIYGQTKYIVRQRPVTASASIEGPVRKKKTVAKKKSVPDVERWTDLADDYYFGQDGKKQDYAEAAKWYRKAAEMGYAEAQYHLGYMYNKGKGVTQDYTEALKWFRKGADQGYAKAQNGLGYMYRNGQGVTQDYAEAIKWFRKAADQDLAMAQSNLADMYYSGFGVAKDYSVA